MTDVNQKKEKVKMHLKDLRLDLKKMHLAVTEELVIPQPDEVKTLIYKMDKLLKDHNGIQVDFQSISEANHFFKNSEQMMTKALDKYLKKETALF